MYTHMHAHSDIADCASRGEALRLPARGEARVDDARPGTNLLERQIAVGMACVWTCA